MSSNAAPTWQKLSYSTVYTFSTEACENVLFAFQYVLLILSPLSPQDLQLIYKTSKDPNVGSASSCRYDPDDQLFEIECLSADAQKALSALAQIVTQYTLQEENNAEEFENASKIDFLAVVDIDLIDVDETTATQKARVDIGAHAQPTLQESWMCQFEDSDVEAFAPDYVLAEIGRLTDCVLSRHPSAKSVGIKLGPTGDVQAARRKLFNLEWCQHREKAVTHVLKTQKNHLFELRFEQLKRLHDGSMGRVLILPESQLHGHNVREFTYRSVCRYYKYERTQQQFVLQSAISQPLQYMGPNSVADSMNAIEFREIGTRAPGPTEMPVNPVSLHPEMKDVADWIQGIPDVEGSDIAPSQAASSASGRSKVAGPLGGSSTARGSGEPMAPTGLVIRSTAPSPASGNHGMSLKPAASRPNHTQSSNPTSTGNKESGHDHATSIVPQDDPEGACGLPARTYDETPEEQQDWAKATTSNNWSGVQRFQRSDSTALPSAQNIQGWGLPSYSAAQTSSAPLISFELPARQTSYANPRTKATELRGSPKPHKKTPQPPKATVPKSSRSENPYGVLSEIFGDESEQDPEGSYETKKPQQPESLLDGDALDQLAQVGSSPKDYVPLLRPRPSEDSARVPAQGNKLDTALGQAGDATAINEHVQADEDNEKKAYRRTMRQRAPPPSICGKESFVQNQRGKKRVGPNLAGFDAMQSLREESVPGTPPKKGPHQVSQPTEMLISAAKAKALGNRKNLPCKYFRRGTCDKGIKDCPHAHTKEALPQCENFRKGKCGFGEDCAFPHIVDGIDINREDPADVDTHSDTHHREASRLEPNDSLPKLDISQVDAVTNPSELSSEPKTFKASIQPPLDNAPPLLSQAPKSFINGVTSALEHARSFRGTINVELQIGRAIVPEVPQDVRDDLTPQGFSSVISRLKAFSSLNSAFTNLVTTSPSDVDFILDVAGFGGRRSPYHAEASLELVCESIDKAEIRIVVDAMEKRENQEPYVSLGESLIGGVYLHAPQRVWDARFLVSGSFRVPVECTPDAKALTDSLFVRVQDGSRLPYAQGRDGGGLRVQTVRLHTLLRYSSGVNNPINLQVRRVREMKIQRPEATDHTNRGLFHAVCLNEEDSITEQLLWYEMSLRLVQHPSQFRENETLELGEEASWRVEDVVEESALRHLEDVATLLVEKMDNVGFHNKGRAWAYERKKREALQIVSEMPDEFW